MTRPAAEAASARITSSVSSAAATSPGVPPTAAAGRRAHPSADEDGHAGKGQQAEEPAADEQNEPLVGHHLRALVGDLLPRGPGVPVGVHERLRFGRMGEAEAEGVDEWLYWRRDTSGVCLREPGEPGVVPELR